MATLNKKPVAKKPAAPVKKAGTPVKKAAVPAKKGVPAKKAPVRRAASARPARPSWSAPADFKPAFFEFQFKTDAQALMIPESVNGLRYRGKWDNPDAKSFDLRSYDMSSLIGFASRMSAAIWAPNVLRRVAPNAAWRIILRVGRRAADGSLTARVIGVQFKAEGKKARWFEDKTEPDFRKIRRAQRWLPAAFTDVQLPPSRRTKKEDDSEE